MQYQGGGSRKALERFLRKAYGICSTYSVYHETEPRHISDVQPGDVLVYPATKNRLGHAMIVLDVARKGSKVAILFAEGFTPACELHVVRNPDSASNPWFFFDGDEQKFQVSAFQFGKEGLRHY